jgi:hypothetical protein
LTFSLCLRRLAEAALAGAIALRPEARWSNGDPVTSADFIYAWRRQVDPKTGTEYAQALAPIVGAMAIATGHAPVSNLGVDAPDLCSNTRVVETMPRTPTSPFLRKLAARVGSVGGWLSLSARRLIAPPSELLAALRLLPQTQDFQVRPSTSAAIRKRPALDRRDCRAPRRAARAQGQLRLGRTLRSIARTSWRRRF